MRASSTVAGRRSNAYCKSLDVTQKLASNAARSRSQASGVARPLEPGMKERIDRHKDGSIKAKGNTIDGELTGYWEWFRKDGTKMRSGYFDNGKQVGEWTTYDAKGKVYKVTKMKAPI
jgi:hypothetical protein